MAATNTVFRPPVGFSGLIKKTPKFSTLTVTAASGRQVRLQAQQYPIWKIGLTFNYARGSEGHLGSAYQYIVGFFGAMGGSVNSFLYQDPHDHAVTPEGDNFSTGGFLGFGDGSTTTFQLVRQIGLMTDIVQNPDPSGLIVYINGQPIQSSRWVLNYAGLISLGTPPPKGAVVAWSGNFWHRLHFVDDSLDDLEMLFGNLGGGPVWGEFTLKLETALIALT